METLTTLVHLGLALTFLAASVGKLTGLERFRHALIAFGVPGSMAGAAGVMLPILELAVALFLVVPTTAWWAALAAMFLFALFGTVVSLSLGRGHRPDCACFGHIHSAPIGIRTLVTNALGLAAASFLVSRGLQGNTIAPLSLAGDLNWVDGAVAALGLLVLATCIAIGWFQLQLLRQNGRLLDRIEALERRMAGAGVPVPATSLRSGLPIGAPLPDVVVTGLDGTLVLLRDLLSPGKPALLILVDPDCAPCAALLPEAARWQAEQRSVAIIIFSRGSAEATRRKLTGHGLGTIYLQPGGELSAALEAPATPSAVVIGADGRIASPVAQGGHEIAALSQRAADTSAPASPRVDGRLGTAAPDLLLPSLDGRMVRLTDFRGRHVALLFWNPACGFCARMLHDLRRWERSVAEHAPSLLIVSTGSVEDNGRLQLRSPIVLDEQFAAGRAFGVGGTPSAVLVDAAGWIASAPAIGAEQVLRLIGSPTKTLGAARPLAGAEV